MSAIRHLPTSAPGATPVPVWLVAVFATVTAAAWSVLAALGGTNDIAAVGAAAAAGIAVLVAAVDPPVSRESLPVAGPGLVVITVVAALPASGRAEWPLVLAVVALAALLVATERGVGAGLGAAGAAALVFGTALDVGSATVAAAVLVAIAGDAAGARRHVAVVLFPLGIVIGLFVWTPSSGGAAIVGIVAVVAAAVSPPLALGLLALVVAGLVLPAALLLGAGAVLAAGLRHRLAGALGLPGAIVAVNAVAGRPASIDTVVVAAAIAAVAAALVYPRVVERTRRQLPRVVREAFAPTDAAVDLGRRTGRLPAAIAPAVLGAAWLLLAPATWTWTGVEGLGSYTDGALIAAAAGGIAVVSGWMLGLVALRFDRLDW